MKITLDKKSQSAEGPKDGRLHAAVDTASLERRAALGARLRLLREEHGVSLAALSETTRISVAFLTALEVGALEKLPGRVFARGFIHNVAKNFGVDPRELLAEFAAVWDQPAAKSVLKVEIKNQPSRQPSERTVSLIHTVKSLLRRGVTTKLALPLVLGLAGLYVVSSRPVRKALWQNLRREASIVNPIKAKTLTLSSQPDAGQRLEGQEAAAAASAGVVQAAATPGTQANHANLSDALGQGAAASAGTDAAEGDGDKDGLRPPPSPAAAAAETGDEAALAPADAAGKAKGAGGIEAGAAPGLQAQAAAAASDSSASAAAAGLGLVGGQGGSQSLEVTVSEPVRIRLDLDHGHGVTKQLAPDTYRFNFAQVADMLIYNAGAVKISFNGKPIGSLGGKGRVRRLSFQAPEAKHQNL